MPICDETIPRDLITKLKSGSCVPFIGAGFSAALGLPLWSELGRAIRSHVARSIRGTAALDRFDNVQMAQYFIDLHGGSRQPLTELIQRQFGMATAPFGEHHQLLARLNIPTIVTTNWDSAIEGGLEAEGRPVNVIFKDDQVASWNEAAARQVIKMHGSITDPSSIVVAHEDYLSFAARHEAMEDLLRGVFATKSLLLLGFGLTDQNFDRIYYHVRRVQGRSRLPTFAVFVDEQKHLVGYWSNRGIGIVALTSKRGESRSDRLARFMVDLAEQSATYARTRLDRTKLYLREYREHLQYRRGLALRIRASVGPFGSPKPAAQYRVFSEESDASAEAMELDRLEWQINRVCSEYLRRGAEIRCILSLNEPALRKKYTDRQIARRLGSLLQALRQFPNLTAVLKPGAIERNIVIIGGFTILQSTKASERARLYEEARLSLEQDEVRRAVAEFDREVAAISEENLREAGRLGLNSQNDAETIRRYIDHVISSF